MDDDTLSQKDIDAIVASQRRAKNPSAEAALSEKEAFKVTTAVRDVVLKRTPDTRSSTLRML